MVVGSGSESYETLRHLVDRLPVMIAPAWLNTDTQPIGIDDVLEYLASAPGSPASAGREVQIGGPDVLTYARDARRDGRRARQAPPPPDPGAAITPWLSSLWIGLVTPVDAGVARPLIESLRSPTVVTDPSGAALFDVTPRPFAEALRAAHQRR